ncbi:Arc family DNA-binding protein [Pseudomonas putida]|uniref:Arc family DNA-binding protein n=1 Tax=Pseudomonas putida TaxID=303 RepID=UPI0037CB2B1D
MKATNSRTADKFVVRLPDGMRERVAEVARANHRSMNSEIIDRLEQSLLNNRFEPVQIETVDTEELKSELNRAYRIIDRLLQNSTATQEDVAEVLVLVRNTGHMLTHQTNAVAVGA